MADFSDDEDERGVVATVKSTILTPVHALTSKPARRAYISTALLFTTAIILAGVAITAYTLFYFAYVPARGFSRPIHLQFAPDQHPHGVTPLSRQLVSGQRYDVSVVLHMPRTPTNREAGNFMLDLRLLGLARSGGVLGFAGEEEAVRVLAHERRPAILTYYSPVVEYVHKAVELPWYMLHWRREAETLHVPMFEGVEFAKGWRNVPDTARLELQSEEKMQVYSARLVFAARFGGLRYVMYNHRIASFVVMSSIFWAVEMTFTFVAWLILSFLIFPRSASAPAVKREHAEDSIKEEDTDEGTIDDLSDTSRTFPTYSRQPPLRYSSPRVKKEEEEEGLSGLQAVPLTAEADDEEDEDADFLLDEGGRLGGGRSDSGLGTSMDSSVDRRDSVRRRSRLYGTGGRSS